MYQDQLPELLHRLSHDARVESVTASSAIEGVLLEKGRTTQVLEGAASHLRNRSEKEVRGYRDALDYLIQSHGQEPLSIPFILHLHRLLYGHTPGRGGQLKAADNEIVSRDQETGLRRSVFQPPPYQRTEFLLRELIAGYQAAAAAQAADAVVLIAAFVVDLLAIHPFGDGNGRVARLVTNHLLLSAGYGVVRYVSLEQRIHESRSRYYDALEDSQRLWHEGENTVWPFVEFLADMLVEAYERFEARVAAARPTEGGTKQSRVRNYVLAEAPVVFTKSRIRLSLPGISDQTIANVLRDLQAEGQIVREGLGRSASWRRSTVDQPSEQPS
jgi:Fic family protein